MSKNLSLKEKFNENKQQKDLKVQYGITENNVIVVERKSRVIAFWRASLNFMLSIVRIAAYIALGVSAVVGIAALVFPAPRADMLLLWNNLTQEILHYLGR